MKDLQEGATVTGRVTNLTEFGAFVELAPGVEGLVHISKLSWSRVKHPKEVVQVGQKVKVKVEQASAESGKISLSYRDTLEHPWKNVDQLFPNGSLVKGVVSRLADFGAFVKVAPGVEGLVHISELAHHRVYSVKNHVKEGEEVEVKVLSVDPAAQKMSLSLKATLPAPEKKVDKKEEEVIETTRPLAVPKSNQPLRGGTSRRSDGGSFGLNL
jgi:small subunit ribosomal protein S1